MKKLIAIIPMLILIVSTLILPVFCAVPGGIASGVNFAQIDNVQYRVDYTQSNSGQAVMEQAFYPVFNRNIGGFDYYQVSQSVLTATTGNTLSFAVRLDEGEGQNDILEYLNTTDTYFASAVMNFKNLSTNVTQTFYSEVVIEYYDTNNTYRHVVTSGTNGFKKFEYSNLLRLRFNVTVPYNFTYHAVGVGALTIYQGTQIYDQEGNTVTQSFIPFNDAYFEEQADYNEAYDEGYVDGYNKGYGTASNETYDRVYEEGYLDGVQSVNGTPVQAWSAFLLNAVTGFLSFEIFPGFPLHAMLMVIITIPLAIAFLKIFAGG